VDDPLALWHAEHINFAALLDLLELQVASFHAGDRPDYELMIDIVRYLRSYSDLVHHPREDVAFSRMAERDAKLSPVLSRLMQEHRVIAWAGEALLRRLEESAGDAMVARSDVEAAAATYLVYYRHHLNTEERDILPKARQLLQDEDWEAVRNAGPSVADPLIADVVEARYRGLREWVSQQRQNRESSRPH
jgi:hemerythrin-like domain-containing protein